MENNVIEIELCTFNQTPSDTAQNADIKDSTLCFENRDYLSTNTSIDHSNDGTGSLGNGYEEMKYENIILPPPTAYDDAQTHRADSTVYESCSTVNSSSHFSDNSVKIKKQLRNGKSAYTFWNYSIFAIKVICSEVELQVFLDTFYILAGLLLLGFGVRKFNSCPLSASLEYLVLFYAGSAIISGGMNIYMKSRPHPSIYHVFEVTAYRSVRTLMIICCLLGEIEVYVRFPPEVYDMKKSNYCSPLLYWSVVYIFTVTASIIAVIIVCILTAFIWYFL